MENCNQLHLQEFIFGSSVPSVSKRISMLEKNGDIRKIAPRIYTSNFIDTPESIIRRNLFFILGKQYPFSVLSHRSALELQPTSSGSIFVTYTYTKKISLPGVTIRFLKGKGPGQNDSPLSGDLYISHRERAFLENLEVSRQTGPDSKSIGLPQLEEKLDQIIRIHDETEVNKLRDNARKLATVYGMENSYKKLNKIISALLSTHPSKILTSPIATARAFGNPYDPERIQLFETLFRALKKQEYRKLTDENITKLSFKNFAFFESYFSNYIEGTIFKIEVAKQIISTQTPLPSRMDDSHDVLGTYRIASNRTEMEITPKTPEEFIHILKYRHEIMLSARKSMNPGMFKEENNRAGGTFFVDFNLVNGTLMKSFDYYKALDNPFSKAAYIMFVVSEVHPFNDGNGRIARIMMNAELASAGQSKIIIPTVFREDYMLALRKLTRQEEPKSYIKMLRKIHEFSNTIHDDSLDVMQEFLERCNAFKEHNEARLKLVAH